MDTGNVDTGMWTLECGHWECGHWNVDIGNVDTGMLIGTIGTFRGKALILKTRLLSRLFFAIALLKSWLEVFLSFFLTFKNV